MKELNLVILCGGRGSRINKITNNIPKPIIKFNGIYFLQYLINFYSRYNFKTIYLLAGYKGEKIKKIFTENRLNIKDSKKIQITKEEAAEFYKVHQAKPFYNDLCSYLSSGPIVVMILEGEDAVSANRKLMGATNPKDAEDNTIRKLYGISIDKNSVHGSDSPDNAKKEIEFFFKS